MTAFKLRTAKGQKYVDVSLFCGENGKALQLAGGIKLYPEEWEVLRRTLTEGEKHVGNVLVHFEEAK